MAAQSQSQLDLLLPEIQLQILLHLESFDTLKATILASPRMYQVFRLNKKTTLSTVAHRIFNPVATQAALAIERLHEIEEPPFSKDTVLKYFDITLDRVDDSFNLVLPLPVSTKLAKLDEIVRFFSDDYAQNTLPVLAELKSLEPSAILAKYRQDHPATKADLSKSELIRLRRGFYQFETYRQLFAQCSSDFDHKLRRCSLDPALTAYEQAQLLFSDTPAYQASEVACVRDYLHRRLWGVLEHVEDEAVQSLKRGCPNPKDRKEALDWDWANGGRYQGLADDQHLFSNSGKYNRVDHIEYLLSLGLPYIRRILESVGHERQDLLLHTVSRCNAQCQTVFITEALGLDYHFSNDELYGWYDRDLFSCLDEKTKLDLPPGWLWAHRDGYYQGLVDMDSKGLRDWGYVFWDHERLQKAGILDLE